MMEKEYICSKCSTIIPEPLDIYDQWIIEEVSIEDGEMVIKYACYPRCKDKPVDKDN